MLDSDEVGANERDMIDLTEHADDAGVVNTRNKNSQQVGKKCWLLLEIECQGLVVAIAHS